MNRPLTKMLVWNDESIRIHQLDWKSTPEDFSRLREYVLRVLLEKCDLSRETVFSLVSGRGLDEAIRLAAAAYQDRHLFLGTYVVQRVKCLVFRRLRERADM